MNPTFSLIEVFNARELGMFGNISSVFLLDEDPGNDKMQSIARDMNQPATTFLWPATQELSFHVRWFAPDAEIDLCGHGALAAIAYLVQKTNAERNLHLMYRNGNINGQKEADHRCSIDLDPIPVEAEKQPPAILEEALGVEVKGFFPTPNKHIVLLKDEETLRKMKPDFAKLRQSEIFGYSLTAPGNEVDFVSRTLVPHVQQLEDHATGSSHAALAPFWAAKLQKSEMIAHQLSPRGGRFWCEVSKNSVILSGNYSSLAQGRWNL